MECLLTLPVTQQQVVVGIAVPDVTVGRVYPIHLTGGQWSSNPGIWMTMEELEHYCSVDRQLSPLLYVA